MSVLGLLFQFLGVLLTPFGMFALLFGFVLFFMLPIIPKITNQFHAFARLHLWLGASMLKRAAIVVTEHGDLLLKRMSPDDVGTEKIEFEQDTKEFEDPHHAKTHWMGIPFALADEVHGVLFDPRDALLGERKRKAEQDSEMVVKATQSERQMYEIQGWVRGLFAFPNNTYELPDLNRVREVITGSERAEHPQRVESFYELSRDPYKDGTGATKFIMIVVALVGPFAALWLIASQGGASGATDSVSFGAALVLLLAGSDWIKNVDWKGFLTIALVIIPLPLVFLGTVLVTNVMAAVFIFTWMGIGFWFVPIATQIFKASDTVSEFLAPKLIKLGLLGYDRLVFEWTPSGYKMREYHNMENVDQENVSWHTFLGKITGFTFTPGKQSWREGTVDESNVEARTIADGGPKTNIPSGYARLPDKQRAVYGSFVPSSIKTTEYYIDTGIALGRFAHAATGNKSHERLLQSKEEYGGDNALSDKTIVYAMVGCGLTSTILGVLVFFVL